MQCSKSNYRPAGKSFDIELFLMRVGGRWLRNQGIHWRSTISKHFKRPFQSESWKELEVFSWKALQHQNLPSFGISRLLPSIKKAVSVLSGGMSRGSVLM